MNADDYVDLGKAIGVAPSTPIRPTQPWIIFEADGTVLVHKEILELFKKWIEKGMPI